MKKFIFILFLLFIFGCSADKSTKTLENCADNLYSKKDRDILPSNFELLIKETDTWVPITRLEKIIITLKQAGFSRSEIIKWYIDVVKIPEPINERKAKTDYGVSLETIKIAKKIAKEGDKVLGKFMKRSINDKLQSSNYYRYFSLCEKIRKETPKAFDAKWKKSKVIYNKDL
jgi:hypothetical protein